MTSYGFLVMIHNFLEQIDRDVVHDNYQRNVRNGVTIEEEGEPRLRSSDQNFITNLSGLIMGALRIPEELIVGIINFLYGVIGIVIVTTILLMIVSLSYCTPFWFSINVIFIL